MKSTFDRLKLDPFSLWKQPNRWVTFLGLGLIGGIAFFWRLGSTGLIDETEPLFAEAARQMTVTGDWITPFFNGQPRFDKPPLIYWLMAIAYRTIGVNEWAVRLPSAVAAFALMSLVFYTLTWVKQNNRRLGETNSPSSSQVDSHTTVHAFTPWLAAALVAFNLYTLFFARTGYSDMLLSACMGGALLSFFLGYAQPDRRSTQTRWYLTSYTLMALAVLTKGPVGVVLPGLIIATFLLYLGQGKAILRELHLLKGGLLILGISLPWYILVTLRNGEAYIDSFFGFHNFERFTHVVNDHKGPWYFHLLVVLLGFAPWSFFLPGAIAHFRPWKRRQWQQQPRIAQLGLFALIWFVVILSFFTIAVTKYFSYTLPLIPAAAILVALWWNDQMTRPKLRRTSRSLRLNTLLNLVFVLALAGVCFYSPNWLNDDPFMPNLGRWMQQAGLPVVGGLLWLGVAIAVITLTLRRGGRWGVVANLVGFVAFLLLVLMPALTIIDADRQLPLRQIAQTIVQIGQPNEPVVMTDDGFDKSSLVFYTRRPIDYLDRPQRTIPDLQALFQRQPTVRSVLLIASQRAMRKAQLAPSQYQILQRAGIYQLMRVDGAGIR